MPPVPLAPPDPRRAHYGAFYGLEDVPADRPVVLVHGNCQAESLRVVLALEDDLATLRVPAVHELEAEDLPYLAGWLERADLLVTQPVRDGYRGLPLGAGELTSALRPGARVARVPVIRFAGLHPCHAIVRPPADTGLTPPLVAYHDLRLLAEAAGRREGHVLTVAHVHAIAERSREELRRREAAHGTVVASDLFDRPTFAHMRTLNHPGNPIWAALAERVRAALGLRAGATDPGRELLDAIHAPHEAAVLEAFDLGGAPCPDWRVDGVVVAAEEVRRAHLGFYAARPDVVAAGLARHADALRALGLT